MNMADLRPLKRQAQKNLDAGWTWVFAHPKQALDLTQECEDLTNRLTHIHILAQKAELALADHHLYEDHDPCVKGLLREIKELAAL